MVIAAAVPLGDEVLADLVVDPEAAAGATASPNATKTPVKPTVKAAVARRARPTPRLARRSPEPARERRRIERVAPERPVVHGVELRGGRGG